MLLGDTEVGKTSLSRALSGVPSKQNTTPTLSQRNDDVRFLSSPLVRCFSVGLFSVFVRKAG